MWTCSRNRVVVPFGDMSLESSTGSETAAVTACAHRYEDALVAGDTDAAAAWFDTDDAVSRFGPEGSQVGPAEVSALRAGSAAVAAPVWLDERVVTLGDGVALHLAVLRRGDVTMQRSQVWVDRPQGWRILHAHVSRLGAS